MTIFYTLFFTRIRNHLLHRTKKYMREKLTIVSLSEWTIYHIPLLSIFIFFYIHSYEHCNNTHFFMLFYFPGIIHE